MRSKGRDCDCIFTGHLHPRDIFQLHVRLVNIYLGGKKAIKIEMITRLLDSGYSTKVTKAVCLKNAEITAICNAVREVFLSQPALVELSAPVKIVGDVHGQYTDLIRMFEMCGFPPEANFLFLGDYVDRGKQSLETILLLFCYKSKDKPKAGLQFQDTEV